MLTWHLTHKCQPHANHMTVTWPTHLLLMMRCMRRELGRTPAFSSVISCSSIFSSRWVVVLRLLCRCRTWGGSSLGGGTSMLCFRMNARSVTWRWTSSYRRETCTCEKFFECELYIYMKYMRNQAHVHMYIVDTCVHVHTCVYVHVHFCTCYVFTTHPHLCDPGTFPERLSFPLD